MSGMFRDPLMLVAAAAAAVLTALLAAWGEDRRRRFIDSFATAALAGRLFPAEAAAARRRNALLRSSALVLILVALAAPQWGVELIESKAKTSQAVLAVDVSTSMLAEDVKPNRLERTKAALSLVLDGMAGQRAGVVAFAGDAFIQCPMTTDLGAARALVRRLEAGKLPRQGTSLARAIEKGSVMLARYPGRKAMVLVTDGEDRTGDAVAAARSAAEAGVSLVILGVGTLEGAPIPLKDAEGRTVGYKKDRSGQTVVSRLGESGLAQLAALTRGAYWRLTSDDTDVAAVLRELGKAEGSEASSTAGTRYKNRYRVPLCAAVLLLLLELVLPEVPRRRPVRAAAKAALTLGAVLLLAPAASAEPTEWSLWRGNRAWTHGDPGAALKQYQKTAESSARGRFNAGASRYALGDHEGAEHSFSALTEDLAAAAKDGVKGNDAYFNLGNALFRRQRLPEAAEAYKRCLMIDPTDEDCRHNLVLAQRPQKQRPQPDKKKDDKKDEKKDQPPPPSPKPQSGGMSKEDAERILQAVSEREKEARRRQPLKGSEKEGSGQEDDW